MIQKLVVLTGGGGQPVHECNGLVLPVLGVSLSCASTLTVAHIGPDWVWIDQMLVETR
jgi:hypothetical protein